MTTEAPAPTTRPTQFVDPLHHPDWVVNEYYEFTSEFESRYQARRLVYVQRTEAGVVAQIARFKKRGYFPVLGEVHRFTHGEWVTNRPRVLDRATLLEVYEDDEPVWQRYTRYGKEGPA